MNYLNYSKEQGTLQSLISTVVATISSWTKNQYPKVLLQQFLAIQNFLDYSLDYHKVWTSSSDLCNLFGLNKTSNQIQGSGYLAYLDGILMYSKTEKEHLEMLNYALECLSKLDLK